MNQATVVAPLLSRRLNRLRRSAAAADGVQPVLDAGRIRGAPASDERVGERGRELASELGGRLLAGPGGTVVVIESAVELAIDRERLGRLPFDVEPDRPLACLDLETTGLGTASGTLAFLVGIGTWQGTRLHVRQLLLPDHADESVLLAAAADMLPSDAWLVTYNGKSFDWPLLVSRFRLHRRAVPVLAGHVDLLPVARRLWKHRLGDARLATIERAVGGVRRISDLPGALIPARYFSYLRLRRPALLHDVLDHNRQDIVSLGRLLRVLADDVAAATRWRETHPGDLYGLSRAFTARGRHADALACLDAALEARRSVSSARLDRGLERRILSERAFALARLGRRREAAAVWLALAAGGGSGAAFAWIRLARHREHFDRDARGALAAAQEAEQIAARARQLGHPLVPVERDLARRLPRLQRRLDVTRSAAAPSVLDGWLAPPRGDWAHSRDPPPPR